MTRAKKAKQARRAQARKPPPKPQPRIQRGLLVIAAVAAAATVVGAVLLWREAANEAAPGAGASDPGPVHVHGLGVNPADGALFIATHTGLWRTEPGRKRAERVGDNRQDTMGFTVVGPNRFLGSGHPDLRDAREKRLPPLLGLIESRDAGETWTPISLHGQADFHVLRSAGRHVYGFDASNGRLLMSRDGGKRWQQQPMPGSRGLFDLAPDPTDPKRVLASDEGGLHESPDEGRTWRRVGDAIGLLAWPIRDRVYLVNGGGQVFVSRDAGRSWRAAGEIGGEPAAFAANGPRELVAALHDGTVLRSTDGGVTWRIRSAP